MSSEKNHTEAAETPNDQPVDAKGELGSSGNEAKGHCQWREGWDLRISIVWRSGVHPRIPEEKLASTCMVCHQQLKWRVKSVRVPLGHDPAKRQFVIGSQQHND